MTWYLAEVEEKDIPQLFIISSGDWTDISKGTFSVLDVVNHLNIQSENSDTIRIIKDIRKKMEYLDTGGKLDTQLIAVTNCPDLKGPFTIIEGNRRSVTLCERKELVGCIFFIGTSPDITKYVWAQKSFHY